MPVHQYYTERIFKFQKLLAETQKRETRLSFLRLGSFLLAFLMFFLTFQISTGIAIAVLIAGLIFFGHTLKQHLDTTRYKHHLQYLLEINEKELSCIQGNFLSYPDGNEYLDKNHPYSGDLDIFGKASLFQYLNRTTSNPGSNRLADWLNHPAEIDDIISRQEAISELKDYAEWRQQLMAVGYQYKEASLSPETILEWANETPVFLHRKFLRIAVHLLSPLSALSVVAYFFGAPGAFITLIILVNIFILYPTIQKINEIHRRVSKTVDMLKSYQATMALIENQRFESAKLRSLQEKFKNNQGKASGKIKKLSLLVNKLDYRLNVMVAIPLNIFFFWDIKQVFKLEKWKVQNRENLDHWFSTMAEFEALSSLANLYYNNPEWILPQILSEHFKLKAVHSGHPLIPADRRVANDLEIDHTGKVVIITGSNMSGKSTFLRTCGVNIVLAMTGAPVCAEKFEVSRVLVFTSMRIIDSLEENTSSFYAELKRLALIIQTVEKKEKVFLLMDEILRGTNSNDRHIGSVALIKQLIKNDAAAILATHDLSLSELSDEIPEKIDNYNFDVKIENDELFFDYKLNKGVCKSLNASILMKKMGIKI